MSTSPQVSAAHQHIGTGRANLGPVPFAKSVSTRKTAGFSQADTRHPMIATDQHGRPWSCQVENRSGMPTGLIANDFSAPWLPDQGYLVINPANPTELWIDYRRLYLDRRMAMGLYHQLAVQLASDKSWAMPERGSYTRDVRRILGNPPQPLEPVRAAAQGNPWILGFSDVPDPRLVEFVTTADEIDLDMDEGLDFGEDAYRDALGGDDSQPPAPAQAAMTSVARGRAELDLDAFEDEFEDENDEEERRIAAEAFDDTDDELAQANAGAESAEDLLDAIDTAADRTQVGGKTVGVSPAATERAARQAPRRPAQSRPTSKRGASRGSTMQSLRRKHGETQGAGAKRPRSLADGAKPRISDSANTHEFLVEPPTPKHG